MKLDEIKKLGVKELLKGIAEKKVDLNRLRLRLQSEEKADTSIIGKNRKLISQMMTVYNQKRINNEK